MSNRTDPTLDDMLECLKEYIPQDSDEWCDADVAEAIAAYCKGRLVMGAVLPNISAALDQCGFTEPPYYTGIESDEVLDYYSALNDEFGWI